MTKEDHELEERSTITIPYTPTENYTAIEESTLTYNIQFLSTTTTIIVDCPYLKDGMASWCVDTIVQNQDLIELRSRIKINRKQGKGVSDNLKEIKWMTAAAVFLFDTTLLGQGVLDNVNQSYNTHKIKQVEVKQNSEKLYCLMVVEYDAVISLNLPPIRWTIA